MVQSIAIANYTKANENKQIYITKLVLQELIEVHHSFLIFESHLATLKFISHCTGQYLIEFPFTRLVNCVEAGILALSDTGVQIPANVQDSTART